MEAKIETVKYISAKKKTDAAGVSQTGITDRKTFSHNHNVFRWKVGKREKGKKTRTVWSEERKRVHSEVDANLSRQL